jgi:hypothetical protein
MSTRLYLPSSGAAAVTPSTWNFPTQASTTYTYAAVKTKISSAFATRSGATGTTSPTYRGLLRYVIGPLSAVEISGTVNLCMRVYEGNSGANATLGIAVKIIQPDGSDRSVLLAYVASDLVNDTTYEMTTSTATSMRAYSVLEARPITLTAQTPTAGDYLVIEIGWRSQTTISRTIYERVGDNSSSDLTDGQGETNDYCPWVDFSQTLPIVSYKTLAGTVQDCAASIPVAPLKRTRELVGTMQDCVSNIPNTDLTVVGEVTYKDLAGTVSAVSLIGGAATKEIHPVLLTGYEQGLISASGGGLAAELLPGTGAITIDTSVKKTGVGSLKISAHATSSSQCYVNYEVPESNLLVASMDVLWHAWPDGAGEPTSQILCTCPPGSDTAVGLDLATHKLAVWSNYDVTTRMLSDDVIVLDTWYHIDVRYTNTGNGVGGTVTIDWYVDDELQTQYYNDDYGSPSWTTLNVGFHLTAVTLGVLNVDNFVYSNTSADFPIGRVYIIGSRPDADGTHNNPNVDVIEDGDGNRIDGSTVFAYNHINENPWTGTYGGAGRIQQTAVDGGARYVEVQFEGTDESAILGVSAWLEYAASSATAGATAGCVIRDSNGQETTVWGNPTTRADYSESSCFYKRAIVSTPSGGWTKDHVNALVGRIGYANLTTYYPYWQALMLEVAYTDPSGTIMRRVKGLAGNINECASSVIGDVRIIKEIVSTPIQAMSGTEAVAKILRKLLGITEAHSSAIGDITVTAAEGEVVPLAGTFSGYLSSSAGAKSTKKLSGTVEVSSSVSVSPLEITRKLVSIPLGGTASVTGSLTISGQVALAGVIEASSTIPVSPLKRVRELVGVCEVSSNIPTVPYAHRIREIAGAVEVYSSIFVASLKVTRELIGVCESFSNIPAVSYAHRIREIAGAVEASSSIPVAPLETTRELVSISLDCISSVTGGITVSGQATLVGVVEAISSISTASLEVVKELVGVCGASSSIPNILFLRRTKELSGIVEASSSIPNVLFVRRTKEFAGASSGFMSSSANTKSTRKLVGVIEVVSFISNTLLETTKELVGVSVGGVSNITGGLTLSGRVDLSGVVEVISNISAVPLEVTKELIGVVNAVSNVPSVPYLHRTKEVTGVTVEGISSIAGELTVVAGEVVKLLAGVVEASSYVTGTLFEFGYWSPAGMVDGVSSITGTLKRIKILAGTCDAVSTIAGSLGKIVIKSLAGVVGAVSSVADASLRVTREVVSIPIEGMSSITNAPLEVGRKLVGVQVEGISAVTGNVPIIIRGLAGAVNAITSVFGIQKVRKEFVGIVEAHSTITGALATQGRVDLYGVVEAVSTTSALLKIRKELAGVSTGVSSIPNVSFIRRTKEISGLPIEAISTITGSAKRTKRIGGTVVAVSVISGIIRRRREFVGAVDAVSFIEGDVVISGKAYLRGNVDSVSNIIGAVELTRELAGTSVAVSSISGDGRITRELVGTSVASSLITGSGRRVIRVAGVVSVVSAVTGAAKRIKRILAIEVAGVCSINGYMVSGQEVRLRGTVSPVASISGQWNVDYSLFGTFSASSSIIGATKLLEELSGVSAASSSITALQRVTYPLSGSFVSTSSISGILEWVFRGLIKRFVRDVPRQFERSVPRQFVRDVPRQFEWSGKKIFSLIHDDEREKVKIIDHSEIYNG